MVDNDANYLTAQRYLIEHSGFCVTGDSPFREVPLRVKVVGFFTLPTILDLLMDDGPAVHGTIWVPQPLLHVMTQSLLESIGP
jgi:hypothetical protein